MTFAPVTMTNLFLKIKRLKETKMKTQNVKRYFPAGTSNSVCHKHKEEDGKYYIGDKWPSHPFRPASADSSDRCGTERQPCVRVNCRNSFTFRVAKQFQTAGKIDKQPIIGVSKVSCRTKQTPADQKIKRATLNK